MTDSRSSYEGTDTAVVPWLCTADALVGGVLLILVVALATAGAMIRAEDANRDARRQLAAQAQQPSATEDLPDPAQYRILAARLEELQRELEALGRQFQGAEARVQDAVAVRAEAEKKLGVAETALRAAAAALAQARQDLADRDGRLAAARAEADRLKVDLGKAEAALAKAVAARAEAEKKAAAAEAARAEADRLKADLGKAEAALAKAVAARAEAEKAAAAAETARRAAAAALAQARQDLADRDGRLAAARAEADRLKVDLGKAEAALAKAVAARAEAEKKAAAAEAARAEADRLKADLGKAEAALTAARGEAKFLAKVAAGATKARVEADEWKAKAEQAQAELDRLAGRRVHQEILGLRGELKTVALLVDFSGSMIENRAPSGSGYKTRWDYCLAIIRSWVGHLDMDECVLVVFSDEAQVYPGSGKSFRTSGPDGAAGRKKLVDILDGLGRPNGGTNTLAALDEAYAVDGLSAVILFTDGAPERKAGDPADNKAFREEILARVAKEHARRPVPINTVGVGDYFKPELGGFLLAVADRTGGMFIGR